MARHPLDSPRPPKHVPSLRAFELEYLVGLEPEVLSEIGSHVQLVEGAVEEVEPGTIRLQTMDLDALHRLRTVGSVFAVCHFDVPRPGTLLGTGFPEAVTGFLKRISGRGGFQSFRLSAAGKDSAVFQDLAGRIGAALRLRHDEENGDLLIRFRPGRRGGWELLVRTTPRPLSVRSWRAHDMPGALNATVAAAMTQKISAPEGALWLNVCAGSGSILIEGQAQHPLLRGVGVELSFKRARMAKDNGQLAELSGLLPPVMADGGRLPFADQSVHAIVTDLPWGERVGKRANNQVLYQELVREGARVLLPKRRMQCLTQDAEAFEKAVSTLSEVRISTVRQIQQRGFSPYWFELIRAA